MARNKVQGLEVNGSLSLPGVDRIKLNSDNASSNATGFTACQRVLLSSSRPLLMRKKDGD